MVVGWSAAAQPQTGPSGASGRGRGMFRQPDPIDFSDHTGWQELFDGKTLNGWDGNPDVWRVENGALVGEYKSPEGARNGETFIIWKGGEPANFELKLEIRLEGAMADSGIQYRSHLSAAVPGRGGAAAGSGGLVTGRGGTSETSGGRGAGGFAPMPPADPRWSVGGYQFDFNYPNSYTGQVVDGGRGSRGIVAFRGQMVRTEAGKNPRLLSTLGALDELGSYFRRDDWNQVHLIARGNTLIQSINGHVMAILIDDDAAKALLKGLIALQCSGSGSLKVSFRNIWLKTL
jgi:hypothetical protein